MHITLVDDSIPFDGYAPSNRPLGGAEKAFASLPGALARRGHTVVAYNRCRWGMMVEGAQWETFEARRPLSTDILIAYRKPALLEAVRQARRRVLWTAGPARLLERKAARLYLDEHKPLLLLPSLAAAEGFAAKGLRLVAMPAAVRSEYLAARPEPALPPRALVTTHPAHGLDRLLDLWVERIRPAVPDAELHVTSMSLAAAAEGGAVDEALAPLAAKVEAARAHGVVVARPEGDAWMSDSVRAARVHLYPGHGDDVTAFTLMESQAAGVPAVVRPLGAAPERIADGSSGYVAPDDDAFANLAILLLSDDAVQKAMAAEAKAAMLGRTWDAAAEQLEALLA
ncbi:MAG: glycosyltransferase [Magnetospirillum sp.]|nr:glycosyltransferase [Magnetospirillum sp.]